MTTPETSLVEYPSNKKKYMYLFKSIMAKKICWSIILYIYMYWKVLFFYKAVSEPRAIYRDDKIVSPFAEAASEFFRDFFGIVWTALR